MGVAYGKGAKGRATKLHSEITRSLGHCERCGKTNTLQTAHIITRKYSATRTMLNNAFCLCAACHFFFGNHPAEFRPFIDIMWAGDIYDDLYKLSQKVTKKDWEAEVDRLKELKDLDLPEARRKEWNATQE